MKFPKASQHPDNKPKNRIALQGGSYSLIITAIVLALLIVVNIFASALPSTLTQYDISASQLYSITSNTKAVVNALTKDVTIYWIVQADEEDKVIENLLDKYDSLSDHIEVVKKNPDVYPTFAQQYTDETVENNSLVVESGDRYRFIGYDDIYLYETDMTSYSYNASFDGEGAIGQYGLDEPACSILLSTDQEEYEILLGDYSAMDSQRYVSIGDGNVYLVLEDPLDTFAVTISDLLDRDDIPVFDTVSQITFSGTETYEITYEEEGGPSYREEDVYFTQLDGETLPLDPDKISSYLQDIRFLDTTDYVTYNATEDDLASCGLDNPELTITVDYTTEDEDGNEVSGTFVLSVSRDPEELAAAQEAAENQTGTTDTADTEEEEITAYARVGDSPIIYQITADDYNALMAASYDDLRHGEVLPAEIEDVSQLDITLDGQTYTITSLTDGESRSYYYQEELIDLTDVQNALTALTADSFTTEAATGKKEISLTVTLDLENTPSVQMEFYQYDGSYCLAVVDGEPVSLVARSSVVDLVEAVNAIVLN